jgi:hypothetical protein
MGAAIDARPVRTMATRVGQHDVGWLVHRDKMGDKPSDSVTSGRLDGQPSGTEQH